jgi:hypothetical protein
MCYVFHECFIVNASILNRKKLFFCVFFYSSGIPVSNVIVSENIQEPGAAGTAGV